jgi:hypothetical protein
MKWQGESKREDSSFGVDNGESIPFRYKSFTWGITVVDGIVRVMCIYEDNPWLVC